MSNPGSSLPPRLAAAVGGVSRDGVLGHDQLVLRWEPLQLSIEQGGDAVVVSADEPTTLQVARSTAPRRLFGMIPIGTEHRMELELRTSRRVLLKLSAPMGEGLVAGLPWASREADALEVDEATALTVLAAARRAGSTVATWDEEDEVDPAERELQSVLEERELQEKEDQEDGKQGARGRGLLARWVDAAKRHPRRAIRFGIATACATLGWVPWFQHGGISLALFTLIALVVFISATVGEPSRILAAVYGSLVVAGWPFLGPALGVFEPNSPYPEVSANFYDWEMAPEFTVKDGLSARSDLAGEAVVDGQFCAAVPLVTESWTPAYRPRGWGVCCSAAESPCAPIDSLQGKVFTKLEAPGQAALMAVRNSGSVHGIPTLEDTVLIGPDPEAKIPPPSQLKIIGFGVLFWLIAVAVGNGVVHIMFPLDDKRSRKGRGTSTA